MGKVSKNMNRTKDTIVSVLCIVAIAIICFFALVGRPTSHEYGVRINVCDVDRQLIVVIEQSDFDKNAQSKNLDDCQ